MSLASLKERWFGDATDGLTVNIPKEKVGLIILVDKPRNEEGLAELRLYSNYSLIPAANASSIVAVHGLGGDAYNTWEDDGKIWLRDFLPFQVPNARIMCYGYDSVIAFSKSVAGIDDFAADLLNRLNDERETAQVSGNATDLLLY